MTLIKATNDFYPNLPSMFNDVWGHSWVPQRTSNQSTVPAVNIRESDEGYSLEVAAPGYDKSEFSVVVENEVLTISVEREQNAEQTEHQHTRKEFCYQSFTRKFNVPKDLVDSDRVEASYSHGILTVTIPKREEMKPKPARTIEIQ